MPYHVTVAAKLDKNQYQRLLELSQELQLSKSELLRIALDILLFTAKVWREDNKIFIDLEAGGLIYVPKARRARAKVL